MLNDARTPRQRRADLHRILGEEPSPAIHAVGWCGLIFVAGLVFAVAVSTVAHVRQDVRATRQAVERCR
jgi:hypothetical protein